VSRCRICPAQVVWVNLLPSGSRMPLDATPSPDGKIALVGEQEAQVLTDTAADEARNAGRRLHTSHFATCPNAEDWRRP
jgi:hypothetical protein